MAQFSKQSTPNQHWILQPSTTHSVPDVHLGVGAYALQACHSREFLSLPIDQVGKPDAVIQLSVHRRFDEKSASYGALCADLSKFILFFACRSNVVNRVCSSRSHFVQNLFQNTFSSFW